jgi:hypothetical protein
MDDETKRAILEEARANLERRATVNDWESWIDARIEARLQQERALIIEACGTAIGQMLDEQRAEHREQLTREISQLFALITEMQCTLRALDRTIAHTSVIDMPSPIQSRRDN